ncbi:class I SAM-dependent methyltransferase [Mycolicibacterium sphagni]|uniref:SAM-dependent methyltransferase n=1 Tax=Mycolicibacterium sphagni TaxID=1786 RepID=A0A255DJA6_9MYCO|nr:class I SAM-dependent methyltransferase [Mycolicibacterium sphagni]OYN79527.1 SAM-dependent methyltransferase [Mycolicibacterium sphagni]
MAYMANEVTDIADMPRGGPDASWLDRLLETDCPEYLDRDDVDDEVKRAIVSALDRIGSLFGEHDRNAALVLREVADIVDPTILELGAGHGALSRRLLEQHPTAHVTVSDVNPESVAAMAASDLGDNPRATVRPVDATAIDAADGSFDLAVFALSFHHLRPAQAARVLAEGTRVAGEMLVIDLPRVPSPLHVAKLAALAPLALWWPFAHDGLISSLRSYSPSALRALGAHAGIDVDVSTNPFDRQVVRARRRG